jgi:hypothetical protein
VDGDPCPSTFDPVYLSLLPYKGLTPEDSVLEAVYRLDIFVSPVLSEVSDHCVLVKDVFIG